MTKPKNEFEAMTTKRLAEMAAPWNAPDAPPPEWLVKKLTVMSAEQMKRLMDGKLPEPDGFFILDADPES